MKRRYFSFRSHAFANVVAHDGAGEVFTVRVVNEAQGGGFRFVDLTEIPPRGSVGVHTHGLQDEEAYVIVSGRGLMQLDGAEFEVGPGDVILNAAGGTHGLENIGPEPLRMVVLDTYSPSARKRAADGSDAS